MRELQACDRPALSMGRVHAVLPPRTGRGRGLRLLRAGLAWARFLRHHPNDTVASFPPGVPFAHLMPEEPGRSEFGAEESTPSGGVRMGRTGLRSSGASPAVQAWPVSLGWKEGSPRPGLSAAPAAEGRYSHAWRRPQRRPKLWSDVVY